MREAGARLLARDRIGRDVFLRGSAGRAARGPQGGAGRCDLYDLIAAYGAIRARGEPVVHVVARRAVMTLEEALVRVERLIGHHDGLDARSKASCPTRRIAEFADRALASSFVAALELARQGKVELARRKPSRPYGAGGMKEMADDVMRAVEAVLFAAEEPMTAERYRGPCRRAGRRRRGARGAARTLCRARIELVERGERWHFQTAPDLAHILRREREETRKLSRAAVETLAIIAYHEPVSRAEIEAIRGVQISKGTLDVLMEAGWVGPPGGAKRPAGRSPMPRPRPSSLISGSRAGATCPGSTISRRPACSIRSMRRWNSSAGSECS